MKILTSFLATALFATVALAADPQPPTLSKILDNQLSMVEREVVSLAEAVPAEQYSFAPTKGSFEGVRTFELQAKHIATTIYAVASSSLGQKSPVEIDEKENGPASITGKDAVLKYLKDAFALGHKAMQAITPDNATQLMETGGGRKSSRLGLASVSVWHSFDHYGQMVVYARTVGVIPPASRQ